MLQWLTEHAVSFRLDHNAHREFDMTVMEHLRHRRRIGECPVVASVLDPCAEDIWELRVMLHDGATLDVVSADLSACIRLAEALVRAGIPLPLAA